MFALDVVVKVGRLGSEAALGALPLAWNPLQLRHLRPDQILAAAVF